MPVPVPLPVSEGTAGTGTGTGCCGSLRSLGSVELRPSNTTEVHVLCYSRRMSQSNALGRAVDPILERVIRFGVDLELRDPIRWGLAEHRREVMARTAAEFQSRAASLAPAVIARDPDAIARYDALLAA